MIRRYAFPLVFGLCLLASVLPLWVVQHLPAVDLPQHLFLIHVLGHLDDPSLPYRDIYVARPGLTYLTFYYSVRGMASLVGVETAMKLWLTAVLAGIPLSLWALLGSLGRSRWLALLACPLIYTDNFYWGLVSFLSSIPLTLLVMAAFVRALEVPVEERARHVLGLVGVGLSLVALQLTHGAGMIFPAAALPLLLLTTPSDRTRRIRAVLALVPGVALFFAWVLSGVNRGRQLGAPGEYWKASGPLFDWNNFVFHPIGGKLAQVPDLLSGGFWGWADRPALYALAGAALLVSALGALWRAPATKGWVARLRPALLFALALGYFLLLPQDIKGYMYAIYPRYAQLAALLLIPLLPFPFGRAYQAFVPVAAAVALYAGVNLAVLFKGFDVEAENFELLLRDVPSGSRIMHLVANWGSEKATHAVYLHYAALAALRVNGVPSFSLAIDPSFPVGYRQGAQPPASPWEWRPLEASWEQARWYDVYLARGEQPPEALFRDHAKDVELANRAHLWRLYRRKVAP
ncbi:MAG: hypothetical protein HY901_35760 [Deltaproteobacteria bacterium]|nr:hypothetical protein [Deltaproteobacteria bacterium]